MMPLDFTRNGRGRTCSWWALLFGCAWITLPAHAQDEGKNDALPDLAAVNLGVGSYVSRLADLSCIYEGVMCPVGTTEFREKYQAILKFRNDNSVYVDMYSYLRSAYDGSLFLRRRICALYKSMLFNNSFEPEFAQPADLHGSGWSKGHFGTICSPPLPGRFLFHSFFIEVGKLTAKNCEVIGYDDIGGRRHLKIRVSYGGDLDKADIYNAIVWIDQAEGWFPRRVEWICGKVRNMVVDVPRTITVKSPDGLAVTLPSTTIVTVYMDGATPQDHPVFTETYHLVSDTIRVNQGLADADFQPRDTAKADNTGQLRELSDEYGKKVVEHDLLSRQRNPGDKGKAQTRIDAALRDASLQKKLVTTNYGSKWPSPLEIVRWGSLAVALSCAVLLVYSRRSRR